MGKSTVITQNTDASQNLADSTIYQMSDSALLAAEVGSYTRDSNNISVAGANNVIQQFSDNAAKVVGDAIRLSESVTSKNLQLQTDKDLLKMEVSKEKGITAEDLKDLLKNRKFQIVAASAVAGTVWLYIRKGKK